MRTIITQHYTNEHTEMYNLTSPIVKAYAQSNDIEYISDNTRRCPERSVWWEKISWLRQLLTTVEDGSLIVYEDCDSINLGGDIKSALPSGYKWGQVQMLGGFGGKEKINWFNAGVIFMINSPEVRDFLQRVWDRNDMTDEISLNKESKHNPGFIYSLDVKWNCWFNNHHICPEIMIKSWHGMQYDSKLADMRIFISQLA